MPMQERSVGGGPATGLAKDFVQFLQQGLQTGSFGGVTAGQRSSGANPAGDTVGIAGILNDILSGGAGKLGGSLQDLMRKETDRGVDTIRSRFGASGGMAFGTPAMRAESMLLSEAAPKMTAAVGGLQMDALKMLMPLFMGLSGKGISQRETVMEQHPITQGIGVLGQLAPLIAAPFTGGASLMAPAMSTVAGANGGNSGGAFSIGGSTGAQSFQIDPNLLNMFTMNMNRGF